MDIIVKITDGLGNQLFQYAFGYAYARKTGHKLKIDPLFWGTSLRKYQLEEFQIDYNKKFVSPLVDYVIGFGPRNGRKFKDIYRKLKVKFFYDYEKEKRPMEYDESVYEKNKKTYFEGFWQNPKYFDEYYEDIRRQFTLKNRLSNDAEKYAKQMRESNSVSLHIRRTDYDRDVNNVCLNFSFYEKALQEMQKQIGDFKLFIFTDDKEFVKNTFYLHDYIMVEGLNDIEEFELMHICKNHIIANSTFSWWGAYLAENKGGVVFAPVADMWTEEFYPEGWHVIKSSVG